MREKSEEERLYFIIRALILGQLGGLVFFIGVLILGTINIIGAIILGILMNVFAFTTSRLLDSKIDRLVNFVLRKLSKRKRLKGFIINHF